MISLFCLEQLEEAFEWIVDLRKDYSPNADIWNLKRDWHTIKYAMLEQLNDGSYMFGLLDRYEFEDATLSLWASQDMIALKLLTHALSAYMGDNLPKDCYHIKGHGGLKKAVLHTHQAISHHRYVMRSDIKSYYDSIDHRVLMNIIREYVHHPILLTLVYKACRRTETRGGIFYDYEKKGIPMGSPLSPLLGAIALIPMDQILSQTQDTFYARYMDDWVVLTKTKSALRKVVKKTHQVLQELQLKLHPTKTYIGKISQGFNFLGYYFNDTTILPSKESFRRFHERAAVLYEPAPPEKKNVSKRYKRSSSNRDISEYHVNEEAPTVSYVHSILENLGHASLSSLDLLKRLRRYFQQWMRWLTNGLSHDVPLAHCLQDNLPELSSFWSSEQDALL